MMIYHIVKIINQGVVEKIKGAKAYEIAVPVNRDGKTLPAVGETYVGVDSTFPLQVYHKITGIANAVIIANTYGDSRGDQSNTFQMQMIVFNNKKLTKLNDWDVTLLLQANTPRRVDSDIFKAVTITYTNADLNSIAVYGREYGTGSPYPLGFDKSLIQINYTVQAVYRPGCFVQCADELICKN